MASSSYGHTSAVPDTTTIISAHQEPTPTAAQQNNKMKMGLSSSIPSVNSSRALSLPGVAAAGAGQMVAPPLTMLMTDYKAGQTGAENLSLSGYVELMTLVRC